LKILLVRLRLIGDVVFTTPVIRALRRRYPDAHLTYLVERSAAPVVAHNPHLTDVLTIEKTRGWSRILDDARLAAQLRRQRYDVVIDLHGGPRSGWLTWATRAPMRVGYDVSGRAWMYSHVVHRSRELQPRHSVENQWDLLTAVDEAFAGGPDRSRDRVEMIVSAAAREAVAIKRRAWGWAADVRVVVLHVSAGNPFRRWPEDAFAALAARLVQRSDEYAVVLTSGPSDADAAARVMRAAHGAAGPAAARIVEDHDMSIEELRALLDDAALYVGGDSGPLHVASTSDVPIVGLYGPTLPARSAPWRPPSISCRAVESGPLTCRPCDQRICAPGDFRCLTHIPADAVYDAAVQLLETR
jgi:predicted lipopolysaccharide heptosyltransferase III